MRAPHRKHDHLRFYKYMTADAAKAVLATATLRWSSPTRFNDPFDVPRTVNLGFGEAELRAALHRAFVELLRSDVTPSNPTLAELVTLLRSRKGSVGE